MMPVNEYDEEIDQPSIEGLTEFGFRRTTKDKLNWKLEIQKRLDICIATYKTPAFFQNVERLIKTVIFDLQGYPFKKEITGEIEKLKFKYLVQITFLKQHERDIWFHPLKKRIRLVELEQEYYNDLYNYIFQLIAEKGLLVDVDVYIPIRSKARLSDEI